MFGNNTLSRQKTTERMDRSSWAVLILAILIIGLSAVVTFFRARLPTDGFTFFDEPGPGITFYNGRVLVGVNGVPVDTIIQGAVRLQPVQPPGWESGANVIYEFENYSARYTIHPLSSFSYRDGDLEAWLNALATVAFFLMGFFVFWQRPSSTVARLLLFYGVLQIAGSLPTLVTGGWYEIRLVDYFYRFSFWPTLIFQALDDFSTTLLLHFLLIFPTPKKLLQRKPRLILGLIYSTFFFNLGNTSALPFDSILGGWAIGFSLLAILAIVVGIILTTVHTLRNLQEKAHQAQFRWVAWPLIATGVMFIVLLGLFVVYSWGKTQGWLGIQLTSIEAIIGFVFTLVSWVFLAFPLLLAVGIWRDRLFGIETLASKTLVAGILSGLLIGLYLLVVSLAGLFFTIQNNRLFTVLFIGLVAVLAYPLRIRLQRWVNRLIYGQIEEPIAVLNQLGQQLEAISTPEAVLPAIVETLTSALRLPYAAIELNSRQHLLDAANQLPDRWHIATQSGQPIGEVVTLPLIFHSRLVGRMLVAPPLGGKSFSDTDFQLIQGIARQAGTAIHALQLNQDLQRSRARLVTAQEEERRRLRRDLHDELGPVLASQGLKLGAIRKLITQDPSSAQEILSEVLERNEKIIGEIRRLVHALRPPALDERGLVEAVRDYAVSLYGTEASGETLSIHVQAPPAGLFDLPAAVEAAAFRISLEALHNVQRHANASQCIIQFEKTKPMETNYLRITITDNGIGLPEQRQNGVGLNSMRERAEELGGTFSIERCREGGTIVTAMLPILEGG